MPRWTAPTGARVNALCRLIDAYDFEIELTAKLVSARLAGDAGYAAIQAIPGVGPTLAAILVAEIGDVHRFVSARHLCSWAGLTPRHRESDTTVHRGPITKQGSTLVRWAAVEAAQKTPATAGWLIRSRAGIATRRGRNIATVAVARKILILVYYGLHLEGRARGPPAGGRSGRADAVARPVIMPCSLTVAVAAG